MRSARMLGLVLVAAMPLVGCGEAVGPPEPSESGATDLEFVLPPVIGEAPLTSGFVVDPPDGWVDSILAARGPSLLTTSGPTAQIDATYLVAGFNGPTFWFEYGMYGFGSGYSMSAEYTIYGENGVVRTGTSKGLSVSLGPINTTFVPWFRDSIPVPSHCGLTGNVEARFSIFLGIDIGKIKVATAAERSKTAWSSQPACSPYMPGGGEGGGDAPGDRLVPAATVTRYTICYYELWVDSTGTVVSVVPAGCEPYTGRIA